MEMNERRRFFLAAAIAAALLGTSGPRAVADSNDPLFINLTSNDAHRLDMALTFGGKQMKLGHPLTVFMNDTAVLAAAKSNSAKFPEQQKLIADLVAGGANILVCPSCMKHHGVADDDLLPGLKLSNPDLVGQALFRDDSRTLSW
jgi:sulfur relay (sulfurtransferase) complex TusBCD TusD component (DsrE family)